MLTKAAADRKWRAQSVVAAAAAGGGGKAGLPVSDAALQAVLGVQVT
jgi:hypothetical protein